MSKFTSGIKRDAKKVVINHSVDQTDQTSSFAAKSFNQVYKVFALILSTPDKEKISVGSLRGNAYLFEENDRIVVIGSLEKMIKCIWEC